MNWTNVKKASDIELSGIEVLIDKTDNTINVVTLTDACGNTIRIRMSSYTMYVEVPAKPVMVKHYAVQGKVAGLTVSETFESKYEADNRRDELISAVRYGEDEAVKVEEVEVPEEVF